MGGLHRAYNAERERERDRPAVCLYTTTLQLDIRPADITTFCNALRQLENEKETPSESTTQTAGEIQAQGGRQKEGQRGRRRDTTAMAQFLIKIVNHFASEVITKRLANSRAFQQFAMKTHLKVGVYYVYAAVRVVLCFV